MGKTDSKMQDRNTMKAYKVTDRNGFYDFATVVFAETRNKAKYIATSTDCLEGVEYADISARRIPALDRFYRGEEEMDWYNDADKIAMVRYGNFTCSYEFETEDCEKCSARQWCDRCEVES